jgi:hypothetical protein
MGLGLMHSAQVDSTHYSPLLREKGCEKKKKLSLHRTIPHRRNHVYASPSPSSSLLWKRERVFRCQGRHV